MKNLFRIAACLGLVAGLTGALTSMSAARLVMAAEVDPDSDAKELIKLDEEWSRAAATRDAVKVASYYAEDAIAYPPNEPVAKGRAAAQKVWAAYLVDASFSISWKTLHAEVAKSGELGYTAGTYEDSFKGPDGKKVEEKGKYVCIWKKQGDGGWKAIQDIWNSDAK